MEICLGGQKAGRKRVVKSGCFGCEVVLMMSVATIEKMAESR